jgi:hypothetical protein
MKLFWSKAILVYPPKIESLERLFYAFLSEAALRAWGAILFVKAIFRQKNTRIFNLL